MKNDLTQTVVRLKFEIEKLTSENKELREELQRLSADKFWQQEVVDKGVRRNVRVD